MQMKFCTLVPAHYSSLICDLQPYSMMLYCSLCLSPHWLYKNFVLNVWNILPFYSHLLIGLLLWHALELSLSANFSKSSSMISQMFLLCVPTAACISPLIIISQLSSNIITHLCISLTWLVLEGTDCVSVFNFVSTWTCKKSDATNECNVPSVTSIFFLFSYISLLEPVV